MIPKKINACPLCGASIDGSTRQCGACGENLKPERSNRLVFPPRPRWGFGAGAGFGWILAALGEHVLISSGTCISAVIGGIFGLLIGTWLPIGGKYRIKRRSRPSTVLDSAADRAASSPPPSDWPFEENFAKAKRQRLLWMLGLSIAIGVTAQLLVRAGIEKILPIAGGIGFVLLILSWCEIDARERSYTISKPLRRTIIWFGIVGLPVYFIRTRGIYGILSSMLALLFFAGIIGLQLLAIQITYSLMSNWAR